MHNCRSTRRWSGQGRDAILTDVNPRYEEAAQQEEAESGDEDE